MRYSKQGYKLTEGFEGLRLVAYWDAKGKVWTIGYGHTRGVKQGDTCTKEQAIAWLIQDVAFAEANVNHECREIIAQGKLNQNEFDSLVDFDFNLGDNSLDKSTLLKLVNNGNFIDAVKEFPKWDHAGGTVVAGLLRRRIAEAQLFNSITTIDSQDNISNDNSSGNS